MNAGPFDLIVRYVTMMHLFSKSTFFSLILIFCPPCDMVLGRSTMADVPPPEDHGCYPFLSK